MSVDHLRACEFCPHHNDDPLRVWCNVYSDLSWVNRRGGCPAFPYRPVPKIRGEYVDGRIVSGGRTGQQHQKKADRSYNNARSRRKYGRRS